MTFDPASGSRKSECTNLGTTKDSALVLYQAKDISRADTATQKKEWGFSP